MTSLHSGHVRSPADYETERAEVRRVLALTKRDRRIALGDLMTLVFENHATLRGVLEEALRSEGVDQPGQIATEAESFSRLVPGAGELCAMSVFEVADQAELSRRHAEMDGVTEAVRLEIGDTVVQPEDEHRSDAAVAGIGYLRFRLDEHQCRAFVDPELVVAVSVEHPAYRGRAPLTAGQREALAADLRTT